MKRLNLGAGYDILAGWVNTDIVKLPGIDVIHDLDVAPWPWEDDSVDQIRAIDVFEHVDNPLTFMNECGRVLKLGGMLRLRTCHWQNINAFTDPTHKRFPTERSLDYWIKGTEFYQKYAGAYAAPGVAFQKISIGMEGSELLFVLRRTEP